MASAASPLIRPATEADLPRVVQLIHLGAADGLGAEILGPPLPLGYYEGFRAFRQYPGAALIVAEVEGRVCGTLSFIRIPGLSHGGRPVAQVESVHVAEAMRSRGIGEALVRWAIAEARAHGCWRLQLTSNKSRTDAHRFYERLGFVKSHEGMKLQL